MIFAKHGPVRTLKRKIFLGLRHHGTLEDVFTRIYARNHWGGSESRSGPGSDLRSTEAIRAALPGLVKQHDVHRFLDVPCGDFNWMQHVVDDLGVAYIGGDIVVPLIEHNQRRWGGENVAFDQMDLTCDPLPPADLMLVRDCLFYLSYAEILKFLHNFCRADIRLLLTTSHWPPTGRNMDTVSGGWRFLYLCSPPFCFPEVPLCHIPDYSESALLLFDRAQVIAARDAMDSEIR